MKKTEITGVLENRNLLNICHKFNAMAFLTEKPQLPEYENSIREVYVGGRELWLYLPLN